MSEMCCNQWFSVRGFAGSAGGPIIRLNLSNASLDGVTIFGAGDVESPFGAIEVVDGRLGSVNILDSRGGGAVDAAKRPVGSIFAKSAGGIAITGYNPNCEAQTPACHRQLSANDSRAGGESEAAISVAQEGDDYSRLVSSLKIDSFPLTNDNFRLKNNE